MILDTLTAAEEQELLEAVNEQAWDAACDKIKAAHGGRYPPDWWARVMQSGLGRRVADSWRVL